MNIVNIGDLQGTLVLTKVSKNKKKNTNMDYDDIDKEQILEVEDEEDDKEIKKQNEIEEAIKQLTSTKKELESKFEKSKSKNNEYYKELNDENDFISTYNIYINELFSELNGLKNRINVNIYGIDYSQGTSSKMNSFFDSLETMSIKIRQLNDIIYDCKENKMKITEQTLKEIQELLDQINDSINSDEENLNSQKKLLSKNTKKISKKLQKIDKIVKDLEINKKTYDKKKKDIETEITALQTSIQTFVEQYQNIQDTVMGGRAPKSPKKQKKNNNNNGEEEEQTIHKKSKKLNEDLFTLGTMLLGVKNFKDPKELFKTKIVFDDINDNDNDNGYARPDLLKKNWYEVCYVKEDCDIHDIAYELKAVGLQDNSYFNTSSENLPHDSDVEILTFEIDGKPTNYKIEKQTLKYSIFLKNLEYVQIHLKYKEIPLSNKLSQGDLQVRKFLRNKYYGLSGILFGQKAKYILSIKSDFEVISFSDEFLVKTKDKEYTWAGTVPQGGKKTLVHLSKSEAKWSFYVYKCLKAHKGKLKSTELTCPIYFVEGNNNVNNIHYYSKQTDQIALDQKNRVYQIKFIDTDDKIGEFIVEGELTNRCKGEWLCNLTDEQIEAKIPEDFHKNKGQFKKIATDIINKYNIEHKNDLVSIPDVAKLGKWVNKNIKYDLSFVGQNKINASQVWEYKKGVCDHFTKLFNALAYSLGYQVIYVSGYAINSKNCFCSEDGHAWSVIKVEGKWLPFDATWGIFSGKLPVSHIFESYFQNSIQAKGKEKSSFHGCYTEGQYLG